MTDSLYRGTGGHNYIQDEDNEDTTHQNHIEEIVEELSILSMERISPYTATTRDFKASAMEIVKAYGDQRAEEERAHLVERIEGLRGNTFFDEWNEEKEKLNDATSKEDAISFIEKIIPLAKTCPFCGKVPVFTYRVQQRDTSGYIGHFTSREGCCEATGMGKTELFFCNKDQSENYGLWAKQMFWQIQHWNQRENQALDQALDIVHGKAN